ncbi:MAG: 3-phosphoshikimate 1-carboxyvinyltransferase, partial [Clostridiales bacterium]|nr:3-phosphoshikimate 1-carboxyvinyltransferase [Clostridiales bacterium]
MNIRIHPNKLSGSIDIAKRMPSKSIMHRMLICSALSGQEMQITNPSDDNLATLECMNALLNEENPVLNVRDSASTLRFLIPVSLAFGKNAKFILGESLRNRPINEFLTLLPSTKFEVKKNELTASGKIFPGKYVVNREICSSQYISGLMFALPLLNASSYIIIEEIQSQSYVDLTIDVLERFGIKIKKTDCGYEILGNQSYKRSNDLTVEGDWSYAANFFVANKIGSSIEITGLNKNSKQGDSVIQGIDFTQNEIDVSQCVDIFPILAVLACKKQGETTLTNAKRLRIKECDRLHAMYEELK